MDQPPLFFPFPNTVTICHYGHMSCLFQSDLLLLGIKALVVLTSQNQLCAWPLVVVAAMMMTMVMVMMMIMTLSSTCKLLYPRQLYSNPMS